MIEFNSGRAALYLEREKEGEKIPRDLYINYLLGDFHCSISHILYNLEIFLLFTVQTYSKTFWVLYPLMSHILYQGGLTKMKQLEYCDTNGT